MSNKRLSATYGIVACGGSSSRMGSDKSMLIYNQKQQRYHVYEMLQPFCEKVFISCKEEQAATAKPGYDILPDHAVYDNIGPMAALLTAFSEHPGKNIFLVGCDYPFLTSNDLDQFSAFCNDENDAVAFFNFKENVYEPLLAWYNQNSIHKLQEMFDAKQYSLQHFLRTIAAIKFHPLTKNSMLSVDTADAFSRFMILDPGFWIEHNI